MYAWQLLIAIMPVGIGLLYFGLVYSFVEYWVVYKRRLNDYRLKQIDFLWVTTSAVSLLLLLLSLRETYLKDRISADEAMSLTARQTYVQKMQVARAECMAGTWPAGAVKGKSYSENGNITDACADVTVFIQLCGQLFDDERLWRNAPSLDTGRRFSIVYDSVFGSGFPINVEQSWRPPRVIDPLTIKAKDELSIQAQEVVGWKNDAGESALELKVVHSITSFGYLWPFALATALALRLGKARFDMLVAKSKLPPTG